MASAEVVVVVTYVVTVTIRQAIVSVVVIVDRAAIQHSREQKTPNGGVSNPLFIFYIYKPLRGKGEVSPLQPPQDNLRRRAPRPMLRSPTLLPLQYDKP